MVAQLFVWAFIPLVIAFFLTVCIFKKTYATAALLWIFGGLIAVVPTVIVQFVLGFVRNFLIGFSRVAFDSFIVAAGAEEISKFMICALLVRFWYRRHASTGVMGESSGIISPLCSAILAGLAFGGFENAVYGLAAADPSVLLLRIFTSLLLHTACCMIHAAGFFAKRGYSSTGSSFWYSGSLFAWCFHGLYNMLLISGGKKSEVFACGALVLLIILAIRSFFELLLQSPKN